MTTNEIIEKVKRERIVEDVIQNVKNFNDTKENLEDLAQDIYLILLEDDKIERLYNEGKLKYYIVRIVLNQVRSNTSSFFYDYKRWDFARRQLIIHPTDNNDEEDNRELLCD